VQRFRKGLPEKSKVMVTKNSLMRVACEGVEGWSTVAEKGCSVSARRARGGWFGCEASQGQRRRREARVGLGPCSGPVPQHARRSSTLITPHPHTHPHRNQGDNAWVFVHEDDISDAVKYFNKFNADLEKEAKAAAPKGVEVKPPTELTCVVMDNKYLTPAEFKRCESLPNKMQLITTIARMLKQPAQKLAVGVAAVPRKIAYGVKALSELDEDKSKVVGDVAKPEAA